MGRLLFLFININPYIATSKIKKNELGLDLSLVNRVLENYMDNSVEVHYSSFVCEECELLDSLIGEDVCMYVINGREREYIGLSNNIFKLKSEVDSKSYVIYIRKCNVLKEYIGIKELEERCNYNKNQSLYEL